MSDLGSDKYSIDSGEDERQINISPFPTPFGLCSAEETTTQSQFQPTNQPIPSPNYKFMGETYSRWEDPQYQAKQKKRSKSPKKHKTKLVKNKVEENSFISDVIMHLPQDRKTHKGNCTMFIRQQNPSEFLKIPNHEKSKSTHSNRDIVLPQSILKCNSHDSSFVESQKNLSRVSQRSSSKKVSFEFTKEQFVSMKKIHISNPLTKQKTRFVLN